MNKKQKNVERSASVIAELARFTAFREDGSPIYSGVIQPTPRRDSRRDTGSIEEQIAFFTQGHPYVYRVVIERFAYTQTEEVPCDRSTSLLDTWHERNNVTRG